MDFKHAILNILTFGWWAKHLDALHKFFQRIEPLMEDAKSIVTSLATDIGDYKTISGTPDGKNQILDSVQKWLIGAGATTTQVDEYLKANENASIGSITHNAAALILSNTHGSVAQEVGDIDSAIQNAFSLIQTSKTVAAVKQALGSGTAPAPAPQAPPASSPAQP